MNDSAITSKVRRSSRREKNISFICYRENGEPSTVHAVDASRIAARFKQEDVKNVLEADRCDFEINREVLTAEATKIWENVGQKRGEESIVGYDAKLKYRVTWWRRMLQWMTSLFPFKRLSAETDEQYHKRKTPLFFEKVSRIHLYEAKEKYIFLKSTMDMLQELAVTEEVDSTFWKDESQNHLSMHSRKEVLAFCEKKLDEVKVLLSRRQNDLNFLWREMTQIHIYLLKWVIPKSLVTEHFDFCCEEAKKLAVRKDPEVNLMIRTIAEDNDSDPKKIGDMKRHIRALVERLSTIRTGRIHQQFVNVNCLTKSLVFLVPLLLILIALKPVKQNDIHSAIVVENSTTWPSVFSVIVNPIKFIANKINRNILAFVCFSGLLGGFFSATMRLHAKEYEPGSDAYFGMYVFTKPLIGAVGAVVIFLLFQAGLFNAEIFKEISGNGSLDRTAVFGFSFLAGFSERIVFPTLK